MPANGTETDKDN